MTEPTFTVHYERKFSDGAYGSEGVSLSWTGSYDENEEDQLTKVAMTLRRQVLELLAKSAAPQVAHDAKYELGDLQPRNAVPVPADGDGEDLPF